MENQTQPMQEDKLKPVKITAALIFCLVASYFFIFPLMLIGGALLYYTMKTSHPNLDEIGVGISTLPARVNTSKSTKIITALITVVLVLPLSFPPVYTPPTTFRLIYLPVAIGVGIWLYYALIAFLAKLEGNDDHGKLKIIKRIIKRNYTVGLISLILWIPGLIGAAAGFTFFSVYIISFPIILLVSFLASKKFMARSKSYWALAISFLCTSYALLILYAVISSITGLIAIYALRVFR